MRYYIIPVDSNDVKTTDNAEIAKSWAADEDLIVIDTQENRLLNAIGEVYPHPVVEEFNTLEVDNETDEEDV